MFHLFSIYFVIDFLNNLSIIFVIDVLHSSKKPNTQIFSLSENCKNILHFIDFIARPRSFSPKLLANNFDFNYFLKDFILIYVCHYQEYGLYTTEQRSSGAPARLFEHWECLNLFWRSICTVQTAPASLLKLQIELTTEMNCYSFPVTGI